MARIKHTTTPLFYFKFYNLAPPPSTFDRSVIVGNDSQIGACGVTWLKIGHCYLARRLQMFVINQKSSSFPVLCAIKAKRTHCGME
ncbi:hypothetical protein L596_017726 [Steinernema carpocapsae]|uniref:Uncharacterized protein n=1 Tax=Steinernema carpocapsae TaxID=34508 RepID=A0A4U5N3B1_STECR|nr:hypothetical protein L596_017726 [Steinernema carpocapsae]